MGWTIWGSNSGTGKGFMSSPGQSDGHWELLTSYLMSKLGVLSLGVKQLMHWSGQSALSTTMVENECSNTSLPVYTFMA